MFLTISTWSMAQEFSMGENVSEIEIPVDIISNIIILNAKVNGTQLKFILDTGAVRTTIFNLNGVDSLIVGAGEPSKVAGYGSREPFEAILSKGNFIDIQKYRSFNAEIHVLTGEQISFVPILGREVNGIIGIDFFRNHLIELDYAKEKIRVFSPDNTRVKRKFNTIMDLDNSSGKPYLKGDAFHKNSSQDMSLLLDTGSGDALWIFETSPSFSKPTNGFQDYLGFGLSGNVYGVRSKIELLQLGGYDFEKITVAFPDRDGDGLTYGRYAARGAIGGEVLRRFKLLIDLENDKLYLKKNRAFKSGFFYNMAGLRLREGENELITQVRYNYDSEEERDARSLKKISRYQKRDVVYSYNPKILVNYVAPNSPAEKAGIRVGDQIIEYNGKRKGSFSMGEITQLFYKRPYSTIKLDLKNEEGYYTVELTLLPIVDL